MAASRMSRIPFGVLAAAWMAALSAPVCAAPVISDTVKGLFTHRGIYVLKLGTHKDSSDLTSAEGKLVYEFTGSACSGFSTLFRFVTRLEARDGRSRLIDVRTTSQESGTGAEFKFLNQTYSSAPDQAVGTPVLTEDTNGVAARIADGIEVSIERPRQGSKKIAGNALFPTQHLSRLIDAARAGERVVEIKLFDGTEGGDKVMQTTSVIGKELPIDETTPDEAAANVPELAKVRRWPVTISYYSQDKVEGSGENMPDYQLSFVLYENGVSRHMQLDYGDYVLEGRLVELKPIDPKPCN